MGEMLARTYHESQNKPTYVIREIRETPNAGPRAPTPVEQDEPERLQPLV